MILIMIELNFLCEKKVLVRLKQKTTFALTCFVTKLIDFSILSLRSKIWKIDGFVACNEWKQVTLCIYQRFRQVYVSQNKE